MENLNSIIELEIFKEDDKRVFYDVPLKSKIITSVRYGSILTNSQKYPYIPNLYQIHGGIKKHNIDFAIQSVFRKLLLNTKIVNDVKDVKSYFRENKIEIEGIIKDNVIDGMPSNCELFVTKNIGYIVVQNGSINIFVHKIHECVLLYR